VKGHPITMKALGEWDKDVGVPLDTALRVTMELSGKTGEQAVSRCMIMMAQSTRAMTKTAKKRRPVLVDSSLDARYSATKIIKSSAAKYVETYTQNPSGNPHRIYQFMFSAAGRNDGLNGSWEKAQHIANAGMAPRSWLWGLHNLPGAPYQMGGKPYKGVSKLITLQGRGEMAFGLVYENRLSYILKTVPSNYEELAWRNAGIRIMQDAARKIEKQFQRELKRIGVRDKNPFSASSRRAAFGAIAARYEAA
jgi:hypothetical protein